VERTPDAGEDGSDAGAGTFAETGAGTADGVVLAAEAGVRAIFVVSEGTNEFCEAAGWSDVGVSFFVATGTAELRPRFGSESAANAMSSPTSKSTIATSGDFLFFIGRRSLD
jgi:hypothetical protein